MKHPRIFELEGISIDLYDLVVIKPQEIVFKQDNEFKPPSVFIKIPCYKLGFEEVFEILLKVVDVEREERTNSKFVTKGFWIWKTLETVETNSFDYNYDKEYYKLNPEYQRITKEIKNFRDAYRRYKGSL